jgi:hypothetical protein
MASKMKKFLYSISLLLTLSLVSCQQDDIEPATGYLELTSIGVQSVEIESLSRVADDSGFIVEILRDGQLVRRVNADTYVGVTLETGKYTLHIFSPSYEEPTLTQVGDNCYGKPKYYIEDEVEINANQYTRCKYTLPMINGAVTFKMYDGYEEAFTAATLTVDDVALSPGETVYLDSGNTTYQVSVTNIDNETYTRDYQLNIEAGTHYEITFGND